MIKDKEVATVDGSSGVAAPLNGSAPEKELTMKVYRFAQEIDLSAQRFYQEMAARAKNHGVSRIFRTLADDESALLSRHRALAAADGEVDAEALDRGVNVFEQLRRREDQLVIEDDVAAYRLALDAERDVLQQYRSAAQREQHPAVKKRLVEIARDEERQVTELESLYDFANAPNHYLAWGEFSNLGDFHNFGRSLV
jgi:rubrerythrin